MNSKMSCGSGCMWMGKCGKSTGLLLIRVFVGVLFLIMGYHKLFGGIDMVTGMVSGIGFPAPSFFAYVVALIEFFGGIGLILGISTRVFAALLSFIMMVAFFGIHKASIMMGMAPFLLIGVCAGLACTGPGRFSLMTGCLMGRNACPMHEGMEGGCACCNGEHMEKGKK